MQQGDKGAEGEGEFETQGDVDENAEESEGEGEEGTSGQFLADTRTDRVGLFDGQSGLREVLLQFCHDGVGGAELALHGDEFASVFHRGLQGGFPEVGAFDAAAQVGERDVFLGSQHDEVAAGEVDPEVFLTAPGKEADGTEDEDGREGQGDVAFADEVDAARRDPVDHGQLLQSEIVEHEPENGAGEEQGGEHRGDDAEGQGDGEALDRTGGLPEKDGRGNERGDVGVENGGESFVISRIDGRPE